ncbi:phosphatidylinositol 3,4,5-trisphosphate 3-phosphatase TPTE2-like [Bolinopsis microptera]|uniref:phosphatidylinositol 3,4,5-trisphosphate 3-phosphatase TPTE2-like n=1 Tax=Bolinopsis microptera TaxID=2820187 RepID=UPI003079A830
MSQEDDTYQNSAAPAAVKVSHSRKHGASFVSLDIDHTASDGRTESTDQLNIADENDSTLLNAQFRVRLVVEHIAVQIISILLILIDVGLTAAAIASTDETFDKRTGIVSNVILGYFILEICLRFFGIGPKTFSKSVWEMLDALVIAVSLIIALTIKDPEGSELGRLSVIGRSFRMIRLFRLIPQCRRCILSARLTTSENKRRYREDGYDLDLTYITEKVIAMSFPSSGWLALYRNPLEEVAKFFKSKHPGHFKIYNLCSERDYGYQPFDYSVQRYMIDDHNVPTLHQILDFVRDAQRFIKKSEQNVISVHCKGGKGRTGSMICAYLMYSAKSQFPTGEIAREFFATRRSDMRVSGKFQGVQTPSQCRFIDYWQEIIHKYDCAIPEAPSLFIKTLKVHSPPVQIQEPNCDLLVEVWDRSNVISSFNLASCSSVCKVSFQEDILSIDFLDHVKPCVTGDIKVRFKSPKLPIKYDKASFYLWFNTIFVRGGELFVEREMLDNPHFTKYNKIYNENFGVTVSFDQKQQQRLI